MTPESSCSIWIEREGVIVLVELTVMEHRYQAVLAVVQDGWQVTKVAERLGVSDSPLHVGSCYEAGGLAVLADRWQ